MNDPVACARETCLAPNESLEQKVNYGGLLLQALLEFWPKPYNTEDESDPEQVHTFIRSSPESSGLA